jgi:uncharacterized integral membrane protein
MPDNDAIKQVFARNKAQTEALAKTYVREKYQTAQLTTSIRNRMMLGVWIGGILLTAFIIFMLANTIGRSVLKLEENLEHHHQYLDE